MVRYTRQGGPAFKTHKRAPHDYVYDVPRTRMCVLGRFALTLSKHCHRPQKQQPENCQRCLCALEKFAASYNSRSKSTLTTFGLAIPLAVAQFQQSKASKFGLSRRCSRPSGVQNPPAPPPRPRHLRLENSAKMPPKTASSPPAPQRELRLRARLPRLAPRH